MFSAAPSTGLQSGPWWEGCLQAADCCLFEVHVTSVQLDAGRGQGMGTARRGSRFLGRPGDQTPGHVHARQLLHP